MSPVRRDIDPRNQDVFLQINLRDGFLLSNLNGLSKLFCVIVDLERDGHRN